ncbi:MAG: DUF2891 domain-containing protein [Bacteroidia bacterium]
MSGDFFTRILHLLLCVFSLLPMRAQPPDTLLQRTDPGGRLRLTTAGASHLAKLALRCIDQEYPNMISHVLNDSGDVAAPRVLHPAFFGCFDWHSAVHGHWMLARLLRTYPDLPEAAQIRAKFSANLTSEHIRQEIVYLDAPGRKSFERMYGWAWVLQLATELHDWDDPQAQQWYNALQPLAGAIVDRYLAFLPKQQYPIRSGEHSNTAFGMRLAWDYARHFGDERLLEQLRVQAIMYYGFDTDCPASWEPSGADFLSPCLEEADLMRRVLKPAAFADWYTTFMPTLPARLCTPATVTDRSDGKLVHLDGLNLSRAWCLSGIARRLPGDDARVPVLQEIADLHIEATLPSIADGNYAGEHWLATFAVYALSLF